MIESTNQMMNGSAPEPPTAPLTRRDIAEFRKRLAVSQVSQQAIAHFDLSLDHLDSSLYKRVNDELRLANAERQRKVNDIQMESNDAVRSAIETLQN